MRIGAFLMGGVVGACAAMMMTRKNQQVMTTLNKTMQTMNQFVKPFYGKKNGEHPMNEEARQVADDRLKENQASTSF